MDKNLMIKLEKLNQITLTEEERNNVMDYIGMVESGLCDLDSVDTENVERMVHVMPMTNVLREDVSTQMFTREQLQSDALESMDGYWQVPRLVE